MTSSPSSSPTTFCTITEGYSDGSAGNLTLTTDSTGNQVLAFVKEDGTIDSSLFSGTTLGTARDVTTVIEDINYFIIPAGQTVDVLGTLIVYAKRTQIDGELNGTGGGYAGAVASTTANGARALPGESPSDTNGHGKGGRRYSGGSPTGGGGGSHGKLLFLMCVTVLAMRLTYHSLVVESLIVM